MRNRVKFQIHPCNASGMRVAKGEESYSKQEGKNRHLAGITSGLSVDAHGDRMSESCIKDMYAQHTEKDLTLYVNHQKDFTRAIAILDKAEITRDGELFTLWRLWNSDDNVPTQDKEEAENVWNMTNGLAPYTKPKQFGFSIEGYVDDKDIDKDAKGRIINKVDLDPGVSLVTKPAYGTSVVSGIMKSLNKQTSVKKDILDVMQEESKKTETYFTDKWEIVDLVEESVTAVLDSDKEIGEKSALLEEIYDGYKSRMMSLHSRFDFKNPDRESVRENVVSSPGLESQAKETHSKKTVKSISKTISVLKDLKTKLKEKTR